MKKFNNKFLFFTLALVMMIGAFVGLCFNKNSYKTLAEVEVHNHEDYTAWGAELVEQTSLPTASDSYYLTHDIALSASWTVSNEITLCLNGYNVIFDGGNCITINDGGILTVFDCSSTQHKFSKITNAEDPKDGLWVLDEQDGTNVVTGGCIMGINPAAGQIDGIGVFINAGGTLNLNGGNIVGNYASSGAGGVYAGGTFVMNGGSVCGNIAGKNGGGVYVDGTFTMNGGLISGNIAGENGGGVFNGNGTFVMNDGNINNNTALNGGGVYVTYLSTNILTGGIITNNSASVGDGVYCKEEECFAAGTLITMSDGSQKAIETLEPGESVRVFNHETGEITSSKLFDMWVYPEKHSNLVKLHFSHNIDVTIVYGHSFFEREQNKYVSISKDNVESYVGHEFYNVDKACWETLNSYEFLDGEADAYIISTEKYLNCVANGMLTNEDGFYTMITNIFEYGDELIIDADKKAQDLEECGIYDYENLKCISKEIYDILNLQYLNVAFNKGMITKEEVEHLGLYWSAIDPEFYRGSQEQPKKSKSLLLMAAAPETPVSAPTAPGVYVGGSIKITENGLQNVYLAREKCLIIGTGVVGDGNGVLAPTDDMSIGVTLADKIGAFTTNGTEDDEKYFFSDDEDCFVEYSEENSCLELTMPAHVHEIDDKTEMTFTPWGNKVEEQTSLPDVAGNYYLTCDIELPTTWLVPVGTDADNVAVTNLCLNGHVIKLIECASDEIIFIGHFAELNIYDDNTKEIEHYFTDVFYSEENEYDIGKYWILDDTLEGDDIKHTISCGVITSEYACAINVEGTLNMYNGAICGNCGSANGGPVSVVGGIFNMYDGIIAGNFNIGCGGVCVEQWYDDSEGVEYLGVFNMYGGTIEYNSSEMLAAGVQIMNGIFNMYDGEIKNNTSGSQGGGVSSVLGTFTMQKGTISDNKAMYAGGVSVGGIGDMPGTFIMHGGEIKNNWAIDIEGGGLGGGVFVTATALFMADGGKITNNKADVAGGGVYFAEISQQDPYYCVAEGTKITLKDGTTKNVENIDKENDEVRVFDHITGEISSAKVFYIEKSENVTSGVITLHFSNSIDVTIIEGHSFFCQEENKYVTITALNVENYKNKHFYNLDAQDWETLVSYEAVVNPINSYSIVTEKTLNVVTNGMLSCGDAIYTVMINVFDFEEPENDGDPLTLKYDEEKMAQDIDDSGILYAGDLMYATEETYIALNLKYLYVAVDKGLITFEQILGAGKYQAERDSELVKKIGVYLGGTIQITGNKATEEEIDENFFMWGSDSVIKVKLGTKTNTEDGNNVKAPEDGMSVGITIKNESEELLECPFTINGKSGEENYFFADSEGYVIRFNNNETVDNLLDDFLEHVAVYEIESLKDEISTNVELATEGETVTIIITAGEGNKLKADSLKAVYNDGTEDIELDLTAGENDTYTFTMPAYKVTITAEFVSDQTEVTFDEEYVWNDGVAITYGDIYNEKAPKVYDGEDEVTGLSFTYTYYETEDDGDTWNLLEEKPTNAGSYKVVISVDDDSYFGTSEYAFTISKLKVDVVWNDISYTAEYDPNNEDLSDYEQLKYDYEAGKRIEPTYNDGINLLLYWEDEYVGAGEYTLMATFSAHDDDGNRNYELNEETITHIFTITKATYDFTNVKWNYTEAFTYDKTEKSVLVVNLPEGVSVEKYTSNTATNVGEYTASVTFSYDEDNYNEPTLADLTWKINKASFVDLTQNVSVDYTGEPNFTINLIISYLSFEEFESYYVLGLATSIELCFDENKTWIDINDVDFEENSMTNVGTYYLGYKFGFDNYNDVEALRTVTVNKATNTISNFVLEDWVYGETANTPSADATFGNVVFTYYNEFSGEYTDVVPTNKGTYTVKAEVVGTDNYYGVSQTFEFDILPRELTVTIADKTSVYGDDIVELTATCSGLAYEDKASDIFRLNTNATSQSDVNEYVIWAEDVNGIIARNYNITYIGTSVNTGCSKYKITPKEIEVTWLEKQFTYTGLDQFNEIYAMYQTIDGEYHKLNSIYVKTNKTIIGFSASAKSLCDPFINVGEYTANVYYPEAKTEIGPNYSVPKNCKHIYKILKAENEILTLNIKSWVYGEAHDGPSATADFGTIQFVYSKQEPVSFLIDELPSEVGNYILKAYVIGNDNYASAMKEVNFTIYQKPEDVLVENENGEEVLNPKAKIVDGENGVVPNAVLVVKVVEINNKNETKESRQALNDVNAIKTFEKIFALYEAKLMLNDVEIQPNGNITIKMLIPEKLLNKEFRLYHIHKNGEQYEVMEVESTNIDDGYIIFETNKLSEFAFVAKNDVCFIHWILLATLLIGAGLFVLFYIFMKKDLVALITCGGGLVATIILACFSGCVACVVFSIINAIAFVCGILYIIFKGHNEKEEKVVETVKEKEVVKEEPKKVEEVKVEPKKELVKEEQNEKEVKEPKKLPAKTAPKKKVPPKQKETTQNKEKVELKQATVKPKTNKSTTQTKEKTETVKPKPKPEPKINVVKKVSVAEAKNLMKDEQTTKLTEKSKRIVDKTRKTFINIDTISQYFKDGEVVTIEEIKKRVPSFDKKATYYKVCARGILDKALTVDADEFSVDAAKMIILTGGKVISSK